MPERLDSWTAELLNAAPDAMLVISEQGTISVVNAQAVELFGYDRHQFDGMSVDQLVPERSRDVHPFHRSSYVADASPRPMGAGMELSARRADGTEFPAEISLNVVRRDEGLWIVAAVRDVTERRRAEAKFQALVEAAPDALVGVDTSGRIRLVNAQTERLFGYQRHELVGELLEVLVPETKRAAHPGWRDGFFRNPRPRAMGAGVQLAGRRRDGSEFPAEISLSSIETETGLLVMAGVRDVSDRLAAQAERERLRSQVEQERLERQLQQSQRLESLGQLAGGVAHDFNNLILVVMNYCALASDALAADDRDRGEDRWAQVRADLDEAVRAAGRGAALTRQLLAFARREVVRPQVLQLNEIVSHIEVLLRRTIGEHIELVVDLDPRLRTVTADRGQLEQVLVNLAVNARDAMPTGGRLRIETRNVDGNGTIGAVGAPYVRLRVTDTGVGMTPDVVRRAFEPFFTTKGPGEGSGLGLATVHGIITQALGHVQIESAPGAGSSFDVFLPASDRDPDAVPPASYSPLTARPATILLVEDEPAIRELTRRLLGGRGYSVLVAEDGAEAIEIAERHDGVIDLLLTDVVMPKMLGDEVSRRVVAHRPDIAVIYMSGYAVPVISSLGTFEGEVTLLEKPFTEQQLLSAVTQALARVG